MSLQEKFVARGAGSGHTKVQYGALCWRDRGEGVEVLLITSRDTGRWVIPKGWPMPGLAPEAAAAQEAWEEAGVDGLVSPLCLGRFGYQKVLGAQASVPCAVAVYGIKVARLADRFPEVKERRRQWFPVAEAAGLVDEPELAAIIAGFTPPEGGRASPIMAEDAADGQSLGTEPQRKRKKRRGH